jgi:hypothetical protein
MHHAHVAKAHPTDLGPVDRPYLLCLAYLREETKALIVALDGHGVLRSRRVPGLQPISQRAKHHVSRQPLHVA